MRGVHAQHARAARKRTVADHNRSVRALPARVQREAPYRTGGGKQSFPPLNEEDPRLRLRGSIPSRHSAPWRLSPGLGSAAQPRPDQTPPSEAPPAADPGVWFGRKMASLYEPFPALSSSSVK